MNFGEILMHPIRYKVSYIVQKRIKTGIILHEFCQNIVPNIANFCDTGGQEGGQKSGQVSDTFRFTYN
jgi:hypothetical protein